MIKKINPTDGGIKRPLRVSDLQKLWDAINLIGVKGKQGTFILSGFEEDINNQLTEGVLAHGGKLYYHPADPADPIRIGSDVYVSEKGNTDIRRFEDGTLKDFSFDCTVTGNAGDIFVATFTRTFIETHRSPKQYREVYGALRVETRKDAPPTVVFYPEDETGSDIQTTFETFLVSPNVLRVNVTDSDGASISTKSTVVIDIEPTSVDITNLPLAIGVFYTRAEASIILVHPYEVTRFIGISRYHVKLVFEV